MATHKIFWILFFITVLLIYDGSDICVASTNPVNVPELSRNAINAFFSEDRSFLTDTSFSFCYETTNLNFETFSYSEEAVPNHILNKYLIYYNNKQIKKIDIVENNILKFTLYVKYYKQYRLFSILRYSQENERKITKNTSNQCIGFFCQNMIENELFFVGYDYKPFKKEQYIFISTDNFETVDSNQQSFITWKYKKNKNKSYCDIINIIKLDKNLNPVICLQTENGRILAERIPNFIQKYREVISIISSYSQTNMIFIKRLYLEKIKYQTYERLIRIPVSYDSKADLDICDWKNFFW